MHPVKVYADARSNPAHRIRPAADDLGTAMFVTLARGHLTALAGATEVQP